MSASARRRSFKALGLLLAYPDLHQIACLPPVIDVLKGEALLSDAALADVTELCEELAAGRLLEVQERYVNLFDRTRSLSLHLFEHLHGDSRDRGQAMVDLRARYEASGWDLSTKELPDYLPALCEFLSLVEESSARALLSDAAPLLNVLRRSLAKRGSKYSVLVGALVELSRVRETTLAEGDVANELSVLPATLDQLDVDWEEVPVSFGVGAAHDSCKVTRRGFPPSEPLIQLRRSVPGPAAG